MLKEALRAGAHLSGALGLVQRLNRNRVRILMYHRFPQQHRANFERQCAFLAKHYTVVSLTEAARRLREGEPLENLAVITVDDGYADMRETAFPVLQKYSLPATLFVTTGFINRTAWMPGDRVRYFFAHTDKVSIEVTDDKGAVHAFAVRDLRSPDQLRTLLKRVSYQTRERILAELEGRPKGSVRPIPDEFRPCTWDQLREMARSNVLLGAHTVTHPILSRIETEEGMRREILDSKACLEQETQKEIDTFAYPNGMPQDISPASLACVQENFAAAVTASYGLNAHGAPVHELLRLPCDPDIPVPQMARMMAGPLRRSGATSR